MKTGIAQMPELSKLWRIRPETSGGNGLSISTRGRNFFGLNFAFGPVRFPEQTLHLVRQLLELRLLKYRDGGFVPEFGVRGKVFHSRTIASGSASTDVWALRITSYSCIFSEVGYKRTRRRDRPRI